MHRTVINATRRLGGATLLLATVALPAAGQADGIIEELVVTAQKREQSLVDVPISVSVISGEKLDAFSIETFEALDDYVPNLFVGDSPGNNQLYLRGIGTESGSLALEQSVALFVDGIYGGRARQFQQPFFDVERIEILRGPQGALVGKNTSAGAISITTKKPTEEREFMVAADYEFEFEGHSVTAIASGPLTDRFLGRLAIKRTEIGGYVENLAKGGDEPDGERLFIRATGVYLPNERIAATLRAEYAETDDGGHPFVTAPVGPTKLVYERGSHYPEYDEQETLNLSANVDVDLPDGFTLTSITGWSDLESENYVDSSFTAAPILGSAFFDDLQQFSQEFRLLSPVEQPFNWVLGVYYLDRDVDIVRFTDWNLGPFTGRNDRIFRETSELYSLYGQFNYRINEAFSIAGSLRYTDEEKDGDLVRPIIGVVPPSQQSSSIADSFSDSEVDGSATLQWEPNDMAMFYLSYTQGSKSGAFAGASSGSTAATFTLDPESSESYELGAKLSLLDGTLFIGAALFTTSYEDLQTAAFNGVSFDIANAAEADVDGFEVDLLWSLDEHWRVIGSLGLLNAEYSDFPAGGCQAPDHIIPGCVADLSGSDLAYAPDYSGTLDVEYSTPIGGAVTFTANLGMAFRADTFVHPTLFDEAEQEAYQKVNLRLEVASDAGWMLALVAKNLFDEETFSQAFETPVSAPPGNTPDHFSVTRYLDPPRTMALEARYRF